MNDLYWSMLLNGIWAGLFSGALAVVLTAPPQAIVPSLLCGFAARLIRNVLMGWGIVHGLAVIVAAAASVLLAIALVSRKRNSSLIAIVTGVLPLGAAAAFFNAIKGILEISSLKDQALITASAQLAANLSTVFTTTLAIALGMGVGFLVARLFRMGRALPDVVELG
jgi:uncharacterized membrane protein YjjB (DUF3815 family)